MTLQSTRWRRLLTLTALLVITTGMAASPMRKALAPYVGNTLGSWSLTTSPASSLSSARFAPAVESAAGATELERMGLSNASRGSFELRDLYEHSARAAGRNGGWRSASWQLGNGNWRSFGWWGRWNSGGSWYRSGGGFGRSGSGGGGNGGSGSGGGGGTVRRASGGGGGGGNGGSAAGQNSRPPIFGEHRSGPGGLTSGGYGYGAPGGSIGGPPKLASSPEPSTLILFGTGLATAAGAIRRRLRRK